MLLTCPSRAFLEPGVKLESSNLCARRLVSIYSGSETSALCLLWQYHLRAAHLAACNGRIAPSFGLHTKSFLWLNVRVDGPYVAFVGVQYFYEKVMYRDTCFCKLNKAYISRATKICSECAWCTQARELLRGCCPCRPLLGRKRRRELLCRPRTIMEI